MSPTVSRGGCIILLDVPPSSSITLDGITRVTPSNASQPQGFIRGLFIVDNVPSELQFHLLVVRSGNTKGNSCPGSLPVGFVLTGSDTDNSNECGYDWVFVRRYDKQTEEIANEPLDEVTARNLINSITKKGGELKKYAMSYEQFMGVSRDDVKSVASWKARTTMITGPYLQKQHKLCHAEKIVPSSDTSWDVKPPAGVKSDAAVDGKPTFYPPIPCIDSSISARQLTRHSGTKSYISKLDANLRTWILSGGACSSVSEEHTCPEEYIWNDILNKYYTNKNTEAENYFLADVQFSFLIFLFMECHSSLEHWRDAVSMSSLTIKSSASGGLIQKLTFILQLLSTLYAQLSCIEADFFQEVEYSSGESNFLIGALRRLCAVCDALDETSETKTIKEALLKLQRLAGNRFHVQLLSSQKSNPDCDVDMTTDAFAAECGDEMEDESVNEKEDGPVIVPSDEVDASISRSLLEHQQAQKYNTQFDNEIEQHRTDYPLLFAAIIPHEDVLMTCARILDAGNDVSLVREAAAYLEEVEAFK